MELFEHNNTIGHHKFINDDGIEYFQSVQVLVRENFY